MPELTLQTVEQIMSIYQRIGNIQRIVQRTGKQLIQPHNHLTTQIFLVHDLRMILDMRGACHPAAKQSDLIRPARFFERPPAEKLFFYSQNIHLRTRLVHCQQSRENQSMALHVEHFRTELVRYQRQSLLLYHASSYDGFLYFGSLWRNSIFRIHLPPQYSFKNALFAK